MSFLQSVIIIRITWFRCSELHFKIYTCLISFFLCGMNETLRAIYLLLTFSNLLRVRKNLSIDTDL